MNLPQVPDWLRVIGNFITAAGILLAIYKSWQTAHATQANTKLLHEISLNVDGRLTELLATSKLATDQLANLRGHRDERDDVASGVEPTKINPDAPP